MQSTKQSSLLFPSLSEGFSVTKNHLTKKNRLKILPQCGKSAVGLTPLVLSHEMINREVPNSREKSKIWICDNHVKMFFFVLDATFEDNIGDNRVNQAVDDIIGAQMNWSTHLELCVLPGNCEDIKSRWTIKFFSPNPDYSQITISSIWE